MKEIAGEKMMLDADEELLPGVLPPNCYIVLLDGLVGPLDKETFDDIYKQPEDTRGR